MWVTIPHPRHQMTAQPLPALTSGDPSALDQALYAFLVEKGNRSDSRRNQADTSWQQVAAAIGL